MNRILLAFFIAYLAVRAGEGTKLAASCWALTTQPVVALAVALVFCGAVWLVMDMTLRHEKRGAAIWHWTIEGFLVPLSVYVAWDIAIAQIGHTSPVSGLSFEAQWALYTGGMLMLQAAMSLFGHAIVERAASRDLSGHK